MLNVLGWGFVLTGFVVSLTGRRYVDVGPFTVGALLMLTGIIVIMYGGYRQSTKRDQR